MIPCQGVTKEVVSVFFPVSYHDTDSSAEYGVRGDLVQAAVLERGVVLSGAFPEDLPKAVLIPFQFASNNPTYTVAEANLAVLCGLSLEVNLEAAMLDVAIDCKNFKIPEEVELTERQVLQMSIEAVRRTLRRYYNEEYHDSFQCRLELRNLPKAQQKLADLKTTFQIGKASR